MFNPRYFCDAYFGRRYFPWGLDLPVRVMYIAVNHAMEFRV